ncbi:MAG: acyltransferase [Vicinamibacterales bacterium]|jgi:peptidoglycan/LPS O-acetylase OafA/YrhL
MALGAPWRWTLVPRAEIRLDQLDALRGLLAVYVLTGHARWLLWAGHAEWMRQPHDGWQVPLVYASGMFRFGREAVLIFFALSGFFIHAGAARRLSQGATLAFATSHFYQRRAHRLVAPYLFALLATVACDAIGMTWFPRLYAAATGDPLLDVTFAHSGYTAASIGPALLLLPSSLGQNFGSNGPLWSLAYEVVYYAWYPLWLWARQRSALAAYVVVPAAFTIVSMVVAVPFVASVLVWYPAWLVGAALAEHVTSPRPYRVSPAVAVVVFWIALLAYIAVPSIYVKILSATVFAAAAVYTFAVAQVDRRHPGLVLFEYLGLRSFTIYIVHFPFLALLGAAVIQLTGTRPLAGWLAVGGAASAVAFGCLCFAVCERHFLHRRVAGPHLAAAS